MTRNVVLLAICLCALCGCGRKAAPSAGAPQPSPEQAAQIESDYLPATNAAAAATPVANPPDGQRAPAAPQAIKPIQERLNGAVHAQLTLQLRMFIEKNGRMPGSFSEFANSAMDSVPLAPAGMKFVIDPVDRSVKAVKK